MAKKIIRIYWILFIGGVLSVSGIFIAASFELLGPLPDYKQLENPKTNLATQIISSDGKVLGKYYFNDNRTPVLFEELPNNIVKPLIATEDERFFNHSGIDWKGTARAILYLGNNGGASTISQQLARQLFVGVRSKNIIEALTQKIKEWILSIQLEKYYTKEEIIAMYLNIYDFGYNADGIQSAAKIYFNSELKELELHETATLVGMLKNSSLYNPLRRPELVLNRRNIVFNQMYRNQFLSERELDSLKQIPLNITYTSQSHIDGIATYFRAYLQKFMRNWISKNKKENGESYNLYKDGLRIYTTIDSRMQQIAEESTTNHMKNLQKEFFLQNNPRKNPTAPFMDITKKQADTLVVKSMRRSERWRKMRNRSLSRKEIYDSFYKETPMNVFSWEGDIDTIMRPYDSILYYKSFLNAGMMSMDPRTGHVKSWVGGINYKHFKFDHVFQSKRQVGSTFKPFLYASAIEQLKVSPCDKYLDALFCIEEMKHQNIEEWCPKNSGNTYTGMRTLKNALANSVNTISAQLIDKIGPEPVIKLIKKMGITSKIPNVPSIALGTSEISVYEMAGAYSTFVNKGVYIEPIVITRIQDRKGKILFDSAPKTVDVLSEEAAYVTVKLLEGVTENGSGVRLRHDVANNYVFDSIVTGYPYKFTNPIAGKTGTTQNYSDGWFVGMVPNLVTSVWVGGEDRSIHFDEIAFGQGATMALPIWATYMKSLYENPEIGISQDDFPVYNKLSINVECEEEKVIDTVNPIEKVNLKKLGL